MILEECGMVGFKVKFYWYQIGSGDFLHAFFSTVAYNLENMKWGSRFPVIMKELYQGHLPKEHIAPNQYTRYKRAENYKFKWYDVNKNVPGFAFTSSTASMLEINGGAL